VSPSFAARCPATCFVQLRGVLEHTIVTLLAMPSEAGAQAGACFRTLARARWRWFIWRRLWWRVWRDLARELAASRPQCPLVSSIHPSPKRVRVYAPDVVRIRLQVRPKSRNVRCGPFCPCVSILNFDKNGCDTGQSQSKRTACKIKITPPTR
jgi:hypothetical protein